MSSIYIDNPREFFGSLQPEDLLLLDLRDELYDGSWAAMEQDLEARLLGKPYVFRLVNRIEDDLTRIRKLRLWESSHSVNLRAVAEEIEQEARDAAPRDSGEG